MSNTMVYKKVESDNKEFYDNLYKKRNILFQIIYPFISFDQQSKSKKNYSKLKPIFKKARTEKKKLNYMDYGFGHGSLILKIPQKTNLYGCDISQEAVYNFPRVAKKLGKTVRTATPDKLKELAANEKFAVISLSHVLEHVDDDYAILRELVDVTNTGGHILINLPINEVWDDPKYVRAYDQSSVTKLIEECGLSIVSVEETARINGYFLYLEKVKKVGKLKKLFIRASRLFLAILPIRFIELISNQIAKKILINILPS